MERRFRTSLKDDEWDKQRPYKKPSHDPHFRRKRLPSSDKQESSREYSRFTNSSSEDKSFRSSQEKRKETRNSIPAEAKSQISKNCPESIIGEAFKFLQELQALPTEVFIKLVYLKLDQMEKNGVNGISELSELTKYITKSEEVLCKSIPPSIENIIKKEMLNETEMNHPNTSVTQPVNTQDSHFKRERNDQPQRTDSSRITELLNQVKRQQPPSASATVASSQNPQSYPGFSHGQVTFPYPSTYTPSSNESFPYNAASSSRTPANESFAYNSASSVIPGLTLQEEQIESHSSYNAYESQNSQPSFPYYNYNY